LNCAVGDGVWHNVTTPGGAIPLGTWVHAACIFDNPGNELFVLMNGAELAKGTVNDITNGLGPFGIPTEEPETGFEGLIDEVFIYAGVLSPDAVRRIHACGVDGSRCECDETSPAEYVNCGDANPACAPLPPCNQALP
jgi:hypothetical protein